MTRVYVPGVFDVFHIGHLNYLKSASENGDYLIVAVQDDREIMKQKGVAVVTPLPERVALIEQLRFVDRVISYKNVFQGPLLQALEIDVFACGEEYGRSDLYPDQKRTLAFCREHGIKVVQIPRTPLVSSTQIRGQLKSFWSSRAQKATDLPAGVTTLGSFSQNQDMVSEETLREVGLVRGAVHGMRKGSLLDLGCGDGRLLAPLMEGFERGVGVDYSEELLALARGRLEAAAVDAELVQGDVSAFALPGEAFDAVLLSGIFPCVDDQQLERLIHNVDALSGKGGKILVRTSVGVPSRVNVVNLYSIELGDVYTAYYRTVEEYLAIFAAAGWHVDEHFMLYQHREDSAVWWFNVTH
jgi:glycerol-3-phosphate cytidylyltransferase